jgi:hypothetical protein
VIPEDWIESHSHDWIGLLPVDVNMVKCLRCGIKATIDEMIVMPRCQSHYESRKSGYLNEGIL